MSGTEKKPSSSRLREFFLLERAERRAASFSRPQQQAIRERFDAGMRRLRVAQDLRGPNEIPAALVLQQQASLLLAQAALLSRDEAAAIEGLTPEAAVTRLTSELPANELPSELAPALSLLPATDPLVLDRMPNEEAEDRARQLDALSTWLESRVDARSVSEIRWTRGARIGAACLVLVAALVWIVVRATTPRNLALGKPVQSSSTAFDTTPAGATDGKLDGRFGFHTNLEANAWLTLDLGQEREIRKLKVFGRGDCCHEQSLPLNLDVSLDGKGFKRVAQRTEPFSEAKPWVLELKRERARYVRVQTERAAYLVLGELEVYGK